MICGGTLEGRIIAVAEHDQFVREVWRASTTASKLVLTQWPNVGWRAHCTEPASCELKTLMNLLFRSLLLGWWKREPLHLS